MGKLAAIVLSFLLRCTLVLPLLPLICLAPDLVAGNNKYTIK